MSPRRVVTAERSLLFSEEKRSKKDFCKRCAAGARRWGVGARQPLKVFLLLFLQKKKNPSFASRGP
jgi:hypothetical protein